MRHIIVKTRVPVGAASTNATSIRVMADTPIAMPFARMWLGKSSDTYT